jgi:chemotaxis protein methyltransferase CheR
MPIGAIPEISERDMRLVQTLAYRMAGIRLADGKRQLVSHRLAKRLRERGLDSYGDYCQLVQRPDEAHELQLCINALTTNETYFFRHKPQWDFIAERLMPAWSASARVARVWSAACSTGEEPYSLAILARELMPGRDVAIDATDINDAVLRTAEAAAYGEYALQKVTPLCLARHFRPLGDGRHAVGHAPRAQVRFRRESLLEPGPGRGPYDLVLMRNVLIYFDEPSKARAIQEATRRLQAGGHLIIGGAESLGTRADGLEYITPGIYRKADHD